LFEFPRSALLLNSSPKNRLPSPSPPDRVIDEQKNHRADQRLPESDWQQTVRVPGVPAKQLAEVKGDK
jgi:hypothetical protein